MEALQKFQNLLKELLQFEVSDLDFVIYVIYRILNYKREQIKKFIEEDIKNKVDEVFAKYEKVEQKNIDEELEKVKNEIIKKLGSDAFTPTEEIAEWIKQFNAKRLLGYTEPEFKELMEDLVHE